MYGASRRHVFVATKTVEAGSRKFQFNGIEVICDRIY